MAQLDLRWRQREGEILGPAARITARDWLDFVVDGQSLGDTFAAIGEGYTSGDLIGCLGWATNKDYERGLVRQLLVEQPPELESGRWLLYVCPECGDIGCGAVTVAITEDGQGITWERFRYENNYDEEMWDEASYQAIGPFRFDKAQYRDAILNPSAKEPAP